MGPSHLLLTAALVSTTCLACAHEEELRPAREPRSESAFDTTPPPPSYDPPPAARPRLSQTVTLGETSYAPTPAPGAAPANNGNVNVTVNNNISAPPAVYGGYGYGGYGYGGYRGGYAGDGRSFVPRGAAAPVTPWRGSGWEGAQRTAAPGQTPAVGGNWAPPPSYGPAQMK